MQSSIVDRPAGVLPGWLVPGIVGLGGVFYTLTGLALLLAPDWFYRTIGTFPPFNRHYAGDLGTFLLPLGLGLLWAARAPARHTGLLWVATAASLLHAGNHLYDALYGIPADTSAVTQTFGLFVFAALLLFAAGYATLRARPALR